MACRAVEERKFFTFTWALENASYCWQKSKERLLSPVFVVEGIENTKWRLALYPRGKDDDFDISCGLGRNTNSSGVDNVEIDFEIAFLTGDGTVVLSSGKKRYTFQKGNFYGFDKCVARFEMFSAKRSVFLPHDTLTTRCRIWKSVGEVPESGQWFARTRIGVAKRSFVWNIEKFSTLEPGNEVTYSIMSAMNDKLLLSLNLFLRNDLSSSNSIRCKLVYFDQSIKYCTLQMFLLPASGNAIKCYQDEYCYDIAENTFRVFTLHLKKENLMQFKKLYLPGDVLSLFCECNFSTGIILEEIEKIGCEFPDSHMEQLSRFTCGVEERQPVSTNVCKENTESMHYDHFFCDIKLKTKTGIFPVHKKVLTDMSPVFEKMLSNNVDANDCVFIDDMEDDTVQRVLQYIYAKVVDDLHWKAACNLYAAAEKYQIPSLKSQCTSIFKSKLCPENACEALLFADLHQDNNLLSDVQEFILKYDKDIINSEEWNRLVNKNMKLAADILYLKLNE
ncbi:hypothetical protein AVEN_209623-1 [Araneus ventricosus]|uniref:Speckle-type POZ protein n=1 Tax=Araneus ventricosus TaxID=182803 RepID=A0A4Y2D7I7_ARAVE|nr:hypothetical protein AVEN_209623-1 [Araneus ventricosus]